MAVRTPPLSEGTLVDAALRVLNTPSPHDKAALTREIVALWDSGAIARAYDPEAPSEEPPERPARDDGVALVAPNKAPRLGKGGSAASRVAILHSLAHIESWAMDLAWDAIARFGRARKMPREFFDDFARVALDEARHFAALSNRLEELGSRYGALAAHDGLWDSASDTARSLEARLVVEHCVHEARGLDVLPGTIAKFRDNGDERSATLLESTVYPEEVTHCAAGVRWFTYLHARGDPSAGDSPYEPREETGSSRAGGGGSSCASAAKDPLLARFHDVVWAHFRGVLKPPFNDEARAEAGFGKEWYEPLRARPEWERKEANDRRVEGRGTGGTEGGRGADE